MTRVLTFLLLVSALIIPRAAWAAHEAGHDQPMGSAVEHVHHGDHTHDLAMDDHPGDHASPDGPEGESGLVHDHLPVDVLSAFADLDSDRNAMLAPVFASRHALDRRPDDDPATSSASLLRPPRTA